MEFRSFTDGAPTQGNMSSTLYKCQCLESWNSENAERKRNIHFNADASNKELLFRIIRSVNQLSIHGAVPNWCEQFGLTMDEKGQEKILARGESVNKEKLNSVNSQGVNFLVSSPRTESVSGNRLRENNQNFESLVKTESRRFANSHRYKTIPDADDGVGDSIPVCREYTFPRANPLSRFYAAIPGGTIIGPVIEVHVVHLFGTHELEIEIPSPNNPKRTSWVLI